MKGARLTKSRPNEAKEKLISERAGRRAVALIELAWRETLLSLSYFWSTSTRVCVTAQPGNSRDNAATEVK